MKKVGFLFLLFLCLLLSSSVANANNKATEITFIYINGSNNFAYNNRLKFKTQFEADVKKMHPQIKKRFEDDKLINELFLENGKYTINPEPVTFYWGDRSLKVVETLDKDLNSAKKYSSKIAHQARSIFAHCLHDAVWVQKSHNMHSVTTDLHKIINAETEKGNKIVLLGYSAGSFVTYQYYLTKSKSIVPAQLQFSQEKKEIQDIILNNNVQPTCFDAMLKANIIKYNPIKGKITTISDVEKFKNNYLTLDEVSKTACVNDGTIKGIIGFASPARLFYSEFTDENSDINRVSRLMAQSLIENNVFYLTVNYSNDPFGFSSGENFTLKKLQDTKQIPQNLSKNGKGFIYNKSDNYVPRTFITAHLAYWSTPKRFAKAIVKAYNEGYTHFYNIEK